MLKEVVITGIGVVTPAGLNRRDFTDSLKQAASGYASVKQSNPERFQNFPDGLSAFPLTGFEAPKYAKILDPNIQYALAATEEAIADSGIEVMRIHPERIGIAVSSSKGGMYTFEAFYERFKRNRSALIGARVYSNLIPNIVSQWIARHWKLRGPAKVSVAACATGLYAIMEGIRMVEQNEVDFCIAGAGDASLTRLMMAGYESMGVLSKSMIRPYDRRRDGFLIGEGAGIVLLESAESARARKASVYGRVKAHAYGFESMHPVLFTDSGDGLSRCLKTVLERGGMDASDIDYVSLHGTGTQVGDLYETNQLKRAFGKAAYHISTSSIKSTTGHMLGASGAVEVISCLIAMQEGFIPPTLNLEQPDPACDLNYTPLHAVSREVHCGCSLSMGFGGQLGALLLVR